MDTLPPAGFSPAPTSRHRGKTILIIVGMVIVAASAIHLTYAASAPTPEEIISKQIEMNGIQWQLLADEKNQYIERIGEIEEKQLLLHSQNNGLRTFTASENLPN